MTSIFYLSTSGISKVWKSPPIKKKYIFKEKLPEMIFLIWTEQHFSSNQYNLPTNMKRNHKFQGFCSIPRLTTNCVLRFPNFGGDSPVPDIYQRQLDCKNCNIIIMRVSLCVCVFVSPSLFSWSNDCPLTHPPDVRLSIRSSVRQSGTSERLSKAGFLRVFIKS